MNGLDCRRPRYVVKRKDARDLIRIAARAEARWSALGKRLHELVKKSRIPTKGLKKAGSGSTRTVYVGKTFAFKYSQSYSRHQNQREAACLKRYGGTRVEVSGGWTIRFPRLLAACPEGYWVIVERIVKYPSKAVDDSTPSRLADEARRKLNITEIRDMGYPQNLYASGEKEITIVDCGSITV